MTTIDRIRQVASTRHCGPFGCTHPECQFARAVEAVCEEVKAERSLAEAKHRGLFADRESPERIAWEVAADHAASVRRDREAIAL